MKLNQRGGALLQVLLVIIVFSVLGFALMGNVIGENKRTNTTESNMQTRYLAESGLTYFENDFKRFIATNLNSITLTGFPVYLQTNFLEKIRNVNESYKTGITVDSDSDDINVKAELIDGDQIEKITSDGRVNAKEKIIKVTSTSKIGTSVETLIGYYQPTYSMDIDGPTYPFPHFESGDLAVDFANEELLGVKLLNLLGLKLIDFSSENKFYRVPINNIIGVDLLKNLIKIDYSNASKFRTMNDNRVIATRQDSLLGASVLKGKNTALLRLDVNLSDFNNEQKKTNVLIDGSYETGIKIPILGDLLGLYSMNYSDINFLKLAVSGNAIIQQDRVGDKYWGLLSGNMYTYDTATAPRTFTFTEGLFVNKSLVIGGKDDNTDNKEPYHGASNLRLSGNMVAMENLEINNVDLNIGNSGSGDTIYVHQNANINNACINKEGTSTNKFRLLAKGNITLENNTSCSEFKGLFYSEKDIVIKTNNQPMTIKGALIGNVKVDYPDKLTYIPNTSYTGNINLKDIKLKPQGRSF